MIFFLYGPDIYRKNRKLQQIAEEFIKKRDPSRLNVVMLNAGDTDEETLRQTLRAAPFLAAKRLVILKNFVLGAKRKAFHEALEEVLPSLGEDRVIIVSEDEVKPKKKNGWKNQTAQKVWEYLEKNAQGEEFSELSGLRLEKEIQLQAKTRGVALQTDALSMLAVLSGGDLGWVEKELEKLEAYCSHPQRGKESRGSIALADVQLLCVSEGEANIFEFLDALGNKDRAALLRTAEEQLRESGPMNLISSAARHIRAMLAITLAGQAGAQALNLHPFVAKKAAAQARKWKAEDLKKILFALMALEYKAKSGRIADLNTQLAALLVRILDKKVKV
ncbi:DNA polymerase III subunit delta [Candidatus Uhrbacteria bacterium]|nr:DNA polymerase III subunit delta [Candidatus Uhrbacteria bacterium]